VKRAAQTIRYRCPAAHGAPMPGHIIMGTGPRVRRAYRVLACQKAKSTPALGVSTWRITVESMSAAAGRAEIEAGCPAWHIQWDRRRRRG
jgi:hypothetical protein